MLPHKLPDKTPLTGRFVYVIKSELISIVICFTICIPAKIHFSLFAFLQTPQNPCFYELSSLSLLF